MISYEDLKKFDPQKMYKIYDIWPEIAQKHYESDLVPIKFQEYSHIVFAGMGGSGAISDIFSAILSKTDTHVEVVKGYLLPQTVNSKSLIVTTSVSGNTEETLSILNYAKKSDSNVIAFSDGGKMEKFCNYNKINHRKILTEHSPRASFTGFLFSMLKVLEPIIPIQEKDIVNSIKKLEEQKIKINSSNLTNDNPALSLARYLDNIPLIYYPWGLQAAAVRFKNSLQENTKMHAITEDVIESCHNGIVAWEKSSDVNPILIQGADDYIKTKERWRILKKFFEEKNIEYEEIHSVDGSILTKLINLVYLVDYASIYKAILAKTDPSPVRAIDFVKDRL
jgi:glucose/mannose-6-phosphate isomerase